MCYVVAMSVLTGYIKGMSSTGHSVLIHQSCQYGRYSNISKELKKTREITV